MQHCIGYTQTFVITEALRDFSCEAGKVSWLMGIWSTETSCFSFSLHPLELGNKIFTIAMFYHWFARYSHTIINPDRPCAVPGTTPEKHS